MRKTYGDSSHEEDVTSRKTWKCVFNNFPNNTSKDSHKISSQKEESGKEEHIYFKTTKEDNNTKVTNITYKQMFKLSVKLSRDNDKLLKSLWI